MIEKLNIVEKNDNAAQIQKTANIPINEKYTAEEWNALTNKTNELVEQTNVNTLEIIGGYSQLPTDAVTGQKAFVVGQKEADNTNVVKKQNATSTRGFYEYDESSNKWYQLNNIEGGGGGFEKGYLINNQFLTQKTGGEVIEASEGKLYIDLEANNIYRFSGGNYIVLGNNEVEISQETVIQFQKETDYGTITNPLSSLTFDFTDAKRNVIQCIYYNGQELPAGVQWINGSDALFQANTTFLIVLKWENNSRVIGSLNAL